MFKHALKEYFGEFGRLKSCPREFWVANLINLFDSLGYFAVIFIMALFFTKDLGIADDTSQFIVGWYLGGIVLVTLFVGFIVDALGIKKSLMIAMAFVFIGRGLLGTMGALSMDTMGAIRACTSCSGSSRSDRPSCSRP